MRAILLVFLAFLFACTETSNTETESKTKSPKEETSAKSEKEMKTGLVKTYHPNGKVDTEINYVNGILEGLARQYYEDGILWQEIEYSNGKKHGLAKTWDQKGRLYKESMYSEGYLNGLQKRYNRNGRVRSEVPFIDGRSQVGTKEYKPDGTLIDQPRINVDPLNNIDVNGTMVYKVYLDEQPSKTKYYIMIPDPNSQREQWTELDQKANIGIFEFPILPGQSVAAPVKFKAVGRSVYKNELVVIRDYNIIVN